MTAKRTDEKRPSNPQRRPTALRASRAYRPASLAHLRIRSTRELKPIDGVIAQNRPLRALELGIRARGRNFHIFVSGPAATGKTTTTMGLLRAAAPERPTPSDLVYVHNFERPEEPLVLALPAGQAHRFRRDMIQLVEALRLDIPDAHHARRHQQTLQSTLNRGLENENDSLAELKRKATDLDFLVRSTRHGLTVLPVVDGKPLAQKEYADQPRRVRERIERRRKKLDPHLGAFFELSRSIEKDTRTRIEDLQRSMGDSVVAERIGRLQAAHGADPKMAAYLDLVRDDILDNISHFLPEDDEPEVSVEEFRRAHPQYAVNVLVDNRRGRGAPVIVEHRPTFYNLFGRIEKRVEYGIYSTDHTMIKAGALLRANGGFLVLNAADVLAQPGVWETLKASLRAREVRIEDLGEAHGFLPTSGIRPQPVPADVKLVMIGTPQIYDVLYRHDDDFPKLFRIKAEFDDETPRTRSAERSYARFVAGVCQNDHLLPVALTGLQALVEIGSRWAESQKHLSLAFNDLAGLVIEADVVARAEGAEEICREHVEEALERRDFQISFLRDKMFEDLEVGRVHLLVEGWHVGSINALSVYEDGPHVFGRPTRATARVQAGSGGVLNIDREAHLSGQIHDKGVLILSGYIGGQYGTLVPISALISICFEQSYGLVDGDSASLAEALAILSELAQLPLRQDLAVTGSINQFGDVQAVGGVNAKIEGFYRICRDRGLTGSQGVALPAANVADLMLSTEVRDSMEAGRFHIYPLRSIDQAIALLFDRRPGLPSEEGFSPEDSVHACVLARLDELHRLAEPRHGEGGATAPQGGEGEPCEGDLPAAARPPRPPRRPKTPRPTTH